MDGSRQALLTGRLADERGRRVAFVSHCLLNENTRYLGGAFTAGAVPEVVSGLLEAGVGRLFTEQLRRRLDSAGITVPFVEYDIVAEMGGETQDPVAEVGYF